MDSVQLWTSASSNLIDASDDEKDKTILQLLCSQVMLSIKGNMVVFVCDSQYIASLLMQYREIIYKELTHLIGSSDLFFSTEVGSINGNGSMNLISSDTYSHDYYKKNDSLAGGSYTINRAGSSARPAAEDTGKQAPPASDAGAATKAQAPSPVVHASGTLKSNIVPLTPRFMRADNINPNKTFENYVTDPENKMMVAGAVSVALSPGTSKYNPFYIFGGSGLGKTHILFAIANRIRVTRPDFSLVYTRAEEFIRHYVECMSNTHSLKVDGHQVHFQDLYTEHNVFIVDDIQNFIKAENARNTFFDIIADFLDRPSRQLILASDVPPGNLKNFSSRLTSRFGSGVCCEVWAPSLETRHAITLQKCNELGVKLSEEIINYIANHIRSNVREIEGAIKTLNTHICAYGSISFEEAVKNLSSMVNASNQVLTLDTIKERVAKEFEISVAAMESAERKKTVSMARSMAMALARTLIPSLSLADIGRSFNKDHSSVHEAINRVNNRMGKDADINTKYQSLYLSLKKD